MERPSPLGDADYEALKERMNDLEWARSEMAKAKMAGLDVSQWEVKVRELDTQLKKIKQVYFPGRP